MKHPKYEVQVQAKEFGWLFYIPALNIYGKADDTQGQTIIGEAGKAVHVELKRLMAEAPFVVDSDGVTAQAGLKVTLADGQVIYLENKDGVGFYTVKIVDGWDG